MKKCPCWLLMASALIVERRDIVPQTAEARRREKAKKANALMASAAPVASKAAQPKSAGRMRRTCLEGPRTGNPVRADQKKRHLTWTLIEEA